MHTVVTPSAYRCTVAALPCRAMPSHAMHARCR